MTYVDKHIQSKYSKMIYFLQTILNFVFETKDKTIIHNFAGWFSEVKFKPSLSTKILSINDFVTKLLSKLLRDFSNKVHLKSISKFINKVINRYFFVNEHLKTGPSTKILSVNNFVNKLTITL